MKLSAKYRLHASDLNRLPSKVVNCLYFVEGLLTKSGTNFDLYDNYEGLGNARGIIRRFGLTPVDIAKAVD